MKGTLSTKDTISEKHSIKLNDDGLKSNLNITFKLNLPRKLRRVK